ncbi:MAG: hypothetical protein ACRDI3_04150 [Actinomycetota bacterium]
MAALAYLLLPFTGLCAFALSHRPRVRFHGLQAIVIGGLWALLLYAASALSEAITLAVFWLGTIVWLGFLVATALGRDPRLPGIGTVMDLEVDDETR